MPGWMKRSQKLAFAWIKLVENQLYGYVEQLMFQNFRHITAIFLSPFYVFAFYRRDKRNGNDVVINANNGDCDNDSCD
jgi:hypothetical protein